MSQKEVPSSDQQQSRKTCQTPAIPHPERSPDQPRPRDRDLPNRARHISLSAALMHQPTPRPEEPQPQNPSQPKPRPGQGNPDSTEVPHSATDLTPTDLSRDTWHIKVPHNSYIIARSNVESLAQLYGFFYVCFRISARH